MHLTLKKEATKPAAANIFQQQARFDAFVDQYNRERPHQALGMKVPAGVYARSPRMYRGLEELSYPTSATWTCPRCGAAMIVGPILSALHLATVTLGWDTS